MIKKKFLYLVAFAVFLFSFPLSAYAEEYGTEYPNYIDYSGGTYIEVQSTIGRGTIVLQDTYKIGYFGFYGSAYNLCNISNSTLTGRFITLGGTEYNFRISSFSTPQYYYDNGYTREWRSFTTTQILNTNVEFVDNTELNRDNVLDIFENDAFKYTVFGLLLLIVILLIANIVRSKNAY